MANVEGAMAMEIAQPRVRPVTAVARRTTGQLSADHEGVAQQGVHPPVKGHNKGRGDTAASITSKAKEDQGTSSPMARRRALPRSLSS